jgi:hypothetical protein
MKLNIIINKKESEEEKDYQQLVCDKLEELGCFIFIPKGDFIGIDGNSFCNKEFFIKTGIIQIILKKLAYFIGGHHRHVLSLELEYKKTWEDVYDKIKNIDEITWNFEE